MLSNEEVAVKEGESLEDVLFKVQAELTKELDARFKTLEARVEACHSILLGWDKELADGKVALEGVLKGLEDNPIFKSLLGGGFGF